MTDNYKAQHQVNKEMIFIDCEEGYDKRACEFLPYSYIVFEANGKIIDFFKTFLPKPLINIGFTCAEEEKILIDPPCWSLAIILGNRNGNQKNAQ